MFNGSFPYTALGWVSSKLYGHSVGARDTPVNSQGYNPGYKANGIEAPNRSHANNVKLQGSMKAAGKLLGVATALGTAFEAGAYAGCWLASF